MSESARLGEPITKPERPRRKVRAFLAAITLTSSMNALAAPEPKLPNVEAVKKQHREATVKLLAETVEADGGKQAQESCTATHIGNGWFLTANHCFTELFAGSGYYNRVYDAQSTFMRQYSLRRGSDTGTEQSLGRTDSIVLHGNHGLGDAALVHLNGAEQMPSMKVAKGLPTGNSNYFLTGYPGSANGRQVQNSLKYLGNMTGAQFHDGNGLDNDTNFYIFGVPKGSPDEDNACRPGMSGGTVTDGSGHVYGVLSRGGGTSSMLGTVLQERGVPVDDFSRLCAFAPTSTSLIKRYESAEHRAPSPAELVGGK